MNVYTTRRNKQ